MRKCSKCKIAKTDDAFQLYKGKPNGQCRQCKTDSEKLRRQRIGIPVKSFSYITEMGKLCMVCKQICSFGCFSPSAKGVGGLGANCISCHSNKYQTSESQKKNTSEYRKRNRERYLAAHRIHQFNRKMKTKITSDGTVTDSFMKTLFSIEQCYYCLKVIEDIKQKTVDHMTPLSRGGKHSADNLVMACLSCNCSKRDLTDIEFIRKKNL